MNKNKVTKILVLLLILGLIIMKACSVGAAGGSIAEILGPDNEISNLQAGNNSSFNNLLNPGTTTNTPANTPIANNSGITNRTNTTNSLPKTGTNENIIIGLMVICTAAGIYAFKKVKDYNM